MYCFLFSTIRYAWFFRCKGTTFLPYTQIIWYSLPVFFCLSLLKWESFLFCRLLLSVFLFIMRLVIDEQQMILFTCFVIASAIQIFLCSPIDNDARKLNEKQRLVFRKIARIMSTMVLVVYIILLLLEQLRFSVPVGAGILLTALLQVPCFFTGNHSAA